MSSPRVLLADQDEPLLQAYAERLKREGFEVQSAHDGIECVAKLKCFVPDLLVLEPMILWGQGEGVLSCMREEPDVPRVPVIVLTCGTDLLEEYQLPRFPVLERHQKPMSPAKLVQCAQHLAKVMAVH